MPTTRSLDALTRLGLAYAQDTATRANQSGLGTASDGEAWSILIGAATWSISSNQISFTGDAGDLNVAILGTNTLGDCDLSATFTPSSSADLFALVGRSQGSAITFYRARVPVGGGSLDIVRTVSGAHTVIATTPFTVTGGSSYRLRFRILNNGGGQPVLYAKLWLASSAEPALWTVVTTDTDSTNAITSAGNYGLSLTVNSGTDTIKVKNLIVTQVWFPTVFKQAPLRLGLQSQVTRQRDAALRLALAASLKRDAALRLRVASGQQFRHAPLRLGVAAPRSRDALLRLGLIPPATRLLDGRLRLALQVLRSRDAPLRLRFAASAWRDASLRVKVAQALVRDAALRFRLSPAPIVQKNAALRMVLRANTSRDAPLRFRLAVPVPQQRDAPLRFRLALPSVGSVFGVPFGKLAPGRARYGDGLLLSQIPRKAALSLTYHLLPARASSALTLTYTLQTAQTTALSLYYQLSPPPGFRIGSSSSLVAPDHIVYTPRTVVGRSLLGAPLLQGYRQLTWSYATLSWPEWQAIIAQYQPQRPIVTITYLDESDTWVQTVASMHPPSYGTMTTMLISDVQLTFTLLPPWALPSSAKSLLW